MNFSNPSQFQNTTNDSYNQNQSFPSDRQGILGAGGGLYNTGGLYNDPGGSLQHDNFQGSRNSMMGSSRSFGTPQGRFGGSGHFNQPFGFDNSRQFGQRGGSSRPRYNNSGESRSQQKSGASADPMGQPSSYSGFVKPEKNEDQYEGGDEDSVPELGSTQSSVNRPFSAPSVPHPYSRPRYQGTQSQFDSSRGGGGGGPIRAVSRGVSRGQAFGGGGGTGRGANDNFSNIKAATAAAARATRDATNPNVKCVVLPPSKVNMSKFKRLAEEIKKLKSKRPNAIDTIHSAANIAHVKIQSEIESGPIVRGTGTFFCLVQFDGVYISVSTGLNKRSAKVEAFDLALQKLTKPFQRIVEVDGSSKELQTSDSEFSGGTAKQTVIKPISMVVTDISGEGGDIVNSFQKESNVEAIVDIKRRNYVPKNLAEFVLVEPRDHNTSVNGSSLLRRSADFSKMLLEYDFGAFGSSGSVRCVLKVEGHTLADVIAHSKTSSKIEASQKAVDVLREQCWTILTKQVHDSSGPEITKDEMLDDLASCFSNSQAASMSVPIADNNKGKRLLEKMGWTGGGMGKDGAGIEEPVTMKKVINREGLGLDAKRGVSRDFRMRVTELLENYASSERQDDLVFSPHFRKDERVIIHNECRRLNLKSKSSGQGNCRYLIVRRKRSAFQLLDHVMRCGGETARYKVVPPGERRYPWRSLTLPDTCNNAPPTATVSADLLKNKAAAPSALLTSPLLAMAAETVAKAARMMNDLHGEEMGPRGGPGFMNRMGGPPPAAMMATQNRGLLRDPMGFQGPPFYSQ